MTSTGEPTTVLWLVSAGRVCSMHLAYGRAVELGAASACELRLLEPGAPERAVRLTAMGDRLRLERLSGAAVLLNGVQVSAVETARAGDLIEVGASSVAVGVRRAVPEEEAEYLPADLFEPSVRDALAGGGTVKVALVIGTDRERPVLAKRRDGRKPFALGNAVAVLSETLVPLEVREPHRLHEVAADAGMSEWELLSELFGELMKEEESDPVLGDPVMVALSQILLRATEPLTLEGERGVGKRRLSEWSSRGATRRVRAAPAAQGVSESAAQLREGVLWVPPLRDRPADLSPLIDACLARARRSLGRPELTVSDGAKAALLAHTWPGNLDELEASLFRGALVATSDAIGLTDLPLGLRHGRTERPRSLKDALDEQARMTLLEALAATAWNVTRAAELLDLPRRTVVWRMSRLGLRRPRQG